MRFTDHEIQLAARLRGAGLSWSPHPGQYVFDIDGIVKAPSPFQAGVHLISSTNAMESQVGGADSLRERFSWLPTWHDARAWLSDNGVDRSAVIRALEQDADSDQTDLEIVYELMLRTLERPTSEEA